MGKTAQQHRRLQGGSVTFDPKEKSKELFNVITSIIFNGEFTLNEVGELACHKIETILQGAFEAGSSDADLTLKMMVMKSDIVGAQRMEIEKLKEECRKAKEENEKLEKQNYFLDPNSEDQVLHEECRKAKEALSQEIMKSTYGKEWE